jgi:hypothetical protein
VARAVIAADGVHVRHHRGMLVTALDRFVFGY